MPAKEQQKRKILYFEGLRAICCLMVVLNHFANTFFPAIVTADGTASHFPGRLEIALATSPLNIFYNGSFGLSLLFLLSGFVLSYKYFSENFNKEIIYSAAIKRYFRLAIPVFVSCFLAYFLIKNNLIFSLKIFQITKSTFYLPNYLNFTPNFLKMLSQSFYGYFITGVTGTESLNPILWTMKVEFYGSFLVFFTLLIIGNKQYRYFLYFVLFLIFFNSYLALFIAGMAICDVWVTKNIALNILKKGFIMIPLIILGLFFGSFPPIEVGGSVYQYINLSFLGTTWLNMIFWHTMGSICLFLSILLSRPLQGILQTKILTKLGKISFGIYLTHLLIIFSFSSALFLKISPHFSYLNSVLLTIFISLLLMIGVGQLFVQLIDVPVNGLINLVGGKIKKELFTFSKRKLVRYESK